MPGLKLSPRALARPMVQFARALPVHGDLWRQKTGRGPLVAFLPSKGREGAALLRIYHVAAALPALGWRTMVLPPGLGLEARQRLLGRASPDLVVMQGARHMLNRPALYPQCPILFDMDDADFHLPHLKQAVEQAMPEVAAVIAGSSYVADWCLAAGAGAAHVVWTGAPVSKRPRTPQKARSPILAWGQTRPMDYLREADLVRAVTRALAVQHPGITLRLFDRRPQDDPAFADTFAAPGLTIEWCKKRLYRDYIDLLRDAAVGLAPLCPETPFSRGKSFGKVLAYLDADVPVIASDACEHGAFFCSETGVVSNDPDHWVQAATRLLKDPAARQSMADAARGRFCERLSIEAATTQIDQVLRSYLP